MPLGVPLLLTHGGRDDIVPPEISESLPGGGGAPPATAASCVVLEDEDHFGHIDPENPLWQAVVEWLP